jgi:hypothetical protein
MASNLNAHSREPWNKGKIVGQKAPFRIKDIWALRVRLQMESRVRELALFNLGIDSKLRGCDLVSLKVRDVCHGDQVATRAVVMQDKTQRNTVRIAKFDPQWPPSQRRSLAWHEPRRSWALAQGWLTF